MQASNRLAAVPPSLLSVLFSQETITISKNKYKIPISHIEKLNFIFIALGLVDPQAFRVSHCIPVDYPDVYQTGPDFKKKKMLGC